MGFRKTIAQGIKTGAALTLTTTAAIMLASAIERRKPWSAVNSIMHIVDGDAIEPSEEFDPRASVVGLVLNASAMGFWAGVYEGIVTLFGGKSNAATGILGAIGAYVTDYYVVPKRFTPGIERRLGIASIAAVYAAFAATLALSGKWKRE